MRKIINWILLLGTIISVSIALKYSALPVPEFMSEKLAGFWITTIEEQQQYVLLYDVAVGFMLSALFYFVVDEIPDRVRMYKAKTLIEVPINQLLEHMEQLISVVLAKYERNQCLKELSQKDFFVLDGENQISMEEISYLTTTYYVKNCKKKTAIHQYGTVNKLVKENLKQIVDNISNIKNYEYFYASDNLFVEYIRQIEGCKLIQWYLDGNANDKTKNIPCFRYATTSNAMFEFVELYLCLLKHKFHTEYSVTTLDTKEETDKYHMKRESGAMLQEVVDLQNERKNKALHNLTAVISSSKYTTNILVSQLKKRIIATYIPIKSVKIDELKKFKYIVFIVDSESENEISRLLKQGNISSGILLITEQLIFRKKSDDQITQGNDIISEIFFKSSFKIGCFSIVFNKKEPSEQSISLIISQIERCLYEEE